MNATEEYIMRLIKLKEVMSNTRLGRSTIISMWQKESSLNLYHWASLQLLG
jgi:predicted DNA-binding transcriptional regulator AlpA